MSEISGSETIETTDKATTSSNKSFSSPFDLPTPEGAEGWEELYPYYCLISPERQEMEEGKFWFFDGMHNPVPLYPFDTIMTENWWVAASQMTHRVWPIPVAMGIDQRLVNGHIYISPNGITDPEEIATRNEHFVLRAGHYFENWDEIYDNWVDKVKDCIARLSKIEFNPLPELEPEAHVFEHRGIYSSHDLLKTYNRLIENMLEIGSYHFEMLNLGYGAYLTFREFCQGAFPGITDRTISQMVCGIDNLLLRPDDEVRKLAALAVETNLADIVLAHEDPDEMLAAMAKAEGGSKWLAAFEAAKEPWFHFSTGVGYDHTDPVWIDDLRLPLMALRNYVTALGRGEDIRRPKKALLKKRAEVTAEYRALLTNDQDRATFDGIVALTCKVFPFVEDHNFYVEHWHHTIFWSKVRELADVFVAHNFLDDREDFFYLHRHEVNDALYDLLIGWATGSQSRGEIYWRPVVERRRRLRDALCQWTPPPALGTPPDAITDSLAIMLWGITEERIEEWAGVDPDAGGDTLKGVPASTGKATAPARIVTKSEDLYQVADGEILVCRITAPSWAPVFSRVSAAVSDVGGMMAHTAIISREYGLPAVVGVGFATATIKTGDVIEVDGDAGTVKILQRVSG
jgi:pyruvate, water dikinase